MQEPLDAHLSLDNKPLSDSAFQRLLNNRHLAWIDRPALLQLMEKRSISASVVPATEVAKRPPRMGIALDALITMAAIVGSALYILGISLPFQNIHLRPGAVFLIFSMAYAARDLGRGQHQSARLQWRLLTGFVVLVALFFAILQIA